jgi:hypothetical protein
MRAIAAIALVLQTLLTAEGCGDDDEPADAGPSSAGGTDASGASYDITVGEFLAELQPQKQEILDDYVATSNACRGVKVDPSFVLLVSAAAIDANQDAPLPDLVEEQC